MADVSKVKGDSNQPEPEKAKKKSRDLEEIKEKWSKVGKVDPEQKKKQKHKAQEEFERKLDQTEEAAEPQLGAERKDPSPYEPRTKATPPTSEPPPPSTPPPPSEPPSTQPSEETVEPPQQTHKRKKTHRKEQVEPLSPKELEKEAQKLLTEVEKKTGKEITPLKKEKKIQPQEAPPPPPPKEPLPSGAWEATNEPEKKEQKKAPLPPEQSQPGDTQKTPLPAAPIQASPTPLAAPFANLHPQVAQLFDRMVGVMTVMQTTGAKETTIDLSSPKFESSVFHGAQIVISEFSTAPKAFNIELKGSSAATQLFTENSEELVAAFAAGGYNFKVNRIDVSLAPPTGETKKQELRKVKRKKT